MNTKKILLMIMIIGCVALTVQCGKKNTRPQNTNLAEFTVEYIGTSMEQIYTYKISVGNSAATFEAGYPYRKNMMYKTKITSEELSQFEQLLSDINAASWNGFNKVNTNVLDGHGFKLNIVWQDGKTVSARGTNSFPDNFSALTKGIAAIFEQYIAESKKKFKTDY